MKCLITILMLTGSRDWIYNISKKYGRSFGLDLPYLVKNSFWVGFRQVFGAIAAILISITFARLASQEVFGQYQLILSVLSLVSIISIPGLNTSLMQSAAKGHDGDYKDVVRKSFSWSLIGIPILLMIGSYYFFVGSSTLGIAFMISSVFFPFFYAPNTWDSFLQGKGRFDISAKFSSIQSGMNMIATVLIIFFNRQNIVPIIIVYLFSYVFFNGFYYFKSLRYIENNRHDSGVFKYGYFLTKLNILSQISNNIDTILVGILLGPANLAIYSVVSIIATRIKDILKTFLAILIPKMSRLEISFLRLFEIHRNKFILLFFFQIALSLFFYFAIPLINLILFSEKYAAYNNLAQIFSVTVLFSVPLAFLGYYIQARKNTFALVVTNPIFYAIKIGLNLILIWNFGLIGAVWAFNISTILWFLFSLFGVLHEESKSPERSF